MSAVHIFIADASSLLWFRKYQMHQIRWVLHAPNSHMLALVSKYAIDARIGGWFKPSYIECNQTHLKNSSNWHGCIANNLSKPDMRNWKLGSSSSPPHVNPLKVVYYASSSSIWVVTAWHRIVSVLKILADLGPRIELGSLVSLNSWSYMCSHWVCCW